MAELLERKRGVVEAVTDGMRREGGGLVDAVAAALRDEAPGAICVQSRRPFLNPARRDVDTWTVRPGHATGRLLVGLAAALVAAAASLSGVLGPLEDASVDTRFGLRDTPPVTDIAVVAIDDRSIARARRVAVPRAPPRARRGSPPAGGRERDRLRRAVHRAVAAAREDLALYDAIGRAGSAILATGRATTRAARRPRRRREPRGRIDAAPPPRTSRPTAAASSAATRRARRPARPRRSSPPGASRQTLPASAFDGDGAWIDFRGGPARSRPSRSPTSSTARVPRARCAARSSSSARPRRRLQDLPRDADAAATSSMAGPEIQANAIWTAMHGNPLRDAPALARVLAIALLRRRRAAARAPCAPALADRGRAAPGGGRLRSSPRSSRSTTASSWPSRRRWSALALGTLGPSLAGYALAEARRAPPSRGTTRSWRPPSRERTAELRQTQLEVVAAGSASPPSSATARPASTSSA